VVQLRINRPGSTDYNPPHRDGSLPHLAPTLNVLDPGGRRRRDHQPADPARLARDRRGGLLADPTRRAPCSAAIHTACRRIGRLRSGPLEMVRAPVRFGQALIFTPYLIHGLAFNKSDTKTRMALEMRFQIVR
jgi:hypothetical protein